jgi:hypothetical protein
MKANLCPNGLTRLCVRLGRGGNINLATDDVSFHCGSVQRRGGAGPIELTGDTIPNEIELVRREPHRFVW